MSSNIQHLSLRKRDDRSFNTENVLQLALMQIEEARITHHAEDGDRRIILHSKVGKPRVEFFPLKGRWQEAGNPKRFHGDVSKFVDWFREREAVTL